MVLGLHAARVLRRPLAGPAPWIVETPTCPSLFGRTGAFSLRIRKRLYLR